MYCKYIRTEEYTRIHVHVLPVSCPPKSNVVKVTPSILNSSFAVFRKEREREGERERERERERDHANV